MVGSELLAEARLVKILSSSNEEHLAQKVISEISIAGQLLLFFGGLAHFEHRPTKKKYLFIWTLCFSTCGLVCALNLFLQV